MTLLSLLLLPLLLIWLLTLMLALMLPLSCTANPSHTLRVASLPAPQLAARLLAATTDPSLRPSLLLRRRRWASAPLVPGSLPPPPAVGYNVSDEEGEALEAKMSLTGSGFDVNDMGKKPRKAATPPVVSTAQHRTAQRSTAWCSAVCSAAWQAAFVCACCAAHS